MATVTKPAIKLEDFSNEIAHLTETFSARRFEKGFIDEAAKMMIASVHENFDKGEDVDGNQWKSNAPKTKLGGRFSVDYDKRPSGKKVSSGSVRLTDTGVFMRSFRILSKKFDRIVIGPSGSRNQTIAQAALNWGNKIGGFGKKQVDALQKLMEKYLKESAVK